MKGVRKNAVLVVAGFVLAGTALAQDESVLSFDQGTSAYFATNIALERQMEPQLVLGTRTRITGLIVDCALPRQTWTMLNSSSPGRILSKSLPPSMLPVKVPCTFNGNLTVHDADFALIQFSFP